MIDVVLLVLSVYLAAVVGVSGIAKLERPDVFEAALRLHRLLPSQAVPWVATGLPWSQVAIAVLLVSGVGATVSALLLISLFSCFLAVELALVATKRATECGCYGVAYRLPVDAASVVASLILVLLAAAYVGLISMYGPPSLASRFVAGAVLGLAGATLMFRTFEKRRRPRSVM